MQEPLTPPGADSAPLAVEGKTKVFGLDYKVAATLCYLPIALVNLITSLVVLNSEPQDNRFLRFHAMQSLVMCVVFMVAGIANFVLTLVLSAIPIINLLAGLVNLAFFAVTVLFIWQCVVGMIAASKGEMKHIPYIGQIAEERLGSE